MEVERGGYSNDVSSTPGKQTGTMTSINAVGLLSAISRRRAMFLVLARSLSLEEPGRHGGTAAQPCGVNGGFSITAPYNKELKETYAKSYKKVMRISSNFLVIFFLSCSKIIVGCCNPKLLVATTKCFSCYMTNQHFRCGN